MRLIRFLFWLAALLGVAVGIARLTAIRWWQVPVDDPLLSSSLAPSLESGDWVLLWRATPPAFGSLVVCPDPEDARRVVVGRIMGEEGDALVIENATLTVNGKEGRVERGCTNPTFQVADPSAPRDIVEHCDVEALGSTAHLRGTFEGITRTLPKVTRSVGAGKVFLVSDNRPYPFDSRHYGTLDRASCKETVFFRLISRRGFPDEATRFTYIR
jgi:signal peptidase I